MSELADESDVIAWRKVRCPYDLNILFEYPEGEQGIIRCKCGKCKRIRKVPYPPISPSDT